jgi:uncharacterized protein (TIGR03083 family)
MNPALSPVLTAHLFPELDGALISLLQSLEPDDWRRPTIVPRWTVHHIVAHLLDTALRRLSLCRDGWSVGGEPIRSNRDLVDFINRLNAEGVATLGRYSPAMLTALTELVTPQLAAYLQSLDPMARAPFAVSWAGESDSLNWFDIARELTERWHHQQQIRLATDRPGIMTPRLYGPVLDTFMRALPHAYRETPANDGTVIEIAVPGDCGGRWRLLHRSKQWALASITPDVHVHTHVTIPDDLAWRLLTKGASEAEARARVTIAGDTRLGAVMFNVLAIVG